MIDSNDVDRINAKTALGELSEVTTAVESVAWALAQERGAYLHAYECPNCISGDVSVINGLGISCARCGYKYSLTKSTEFDTGK